MTLYLLKFNNYYNRIVKTFDTLSEYDSYTTQTIEGINFIPNDGISTEQVLNIEFEETPDYLIVANEYSEIVSRWYVINTVRIRAGQYKLTLYRDLISDWRTAIVKAPIFIEKATVGVNDPAIFNPENMTFNQIKTSETLIKDATQSAWYVGYLNKDYAATDPIRIPKSTVEISGEYATEQAYPYYKYGKGQSGTFVIGEDYTYRLLFRNHVGDSWIVGWDDNGNPKTPRGTSSGAGSEIFDGLCTSTVRNKGFLSAKVLHTASEIGKNVLNTVSELDTDWKTGVSSITYLKTNSELTTLLKESGKVYKLGNNYFEVNITTEELDRTWNTLTVGSTYAQDYINLASASGELDVNDVNAPAYGIEYSRVRYYVNLVPYEIESWEFTITNTRNKCEDSPWDLFCIPYHAIKAGSNTTSPEMSRRVVDSIINNLVDQSQQLYDIQLLPYCPIDDYLLLENEVILSGMPNTSDTTRYTVIGDDAVNTVIIYCSKSNFKKTITTARLGVPSSAIEFKVSNECDMYRLVSPNYNGQFEFSLTKTGGISHYNLTMSCKPFNPYIKLAPSFRRLYGTDFGDARGLICGGDFSLSRLNNNWISYELNNKNYQVMFDRQIENLEIQQKYQRLQEAVGVGAGTLQGAAGGYLAGTMMSGNPYAGAIGAAVGAVSSGIAGAADIYINEKLRQETLDYTKDMYGYQLGNIQAMRSSLTKVSVINRDNKLFPMLEYYTATETEKQALRDKITYNGMSVGRIGAIANFLTTKPQYIKGKLIRLEIPGESYNIVSAINSELERGIFINEYTR